MKWGAHASPHLRTVRMMTIFREIQEWREVGSKAAFLGLKHRLSEAIARGWVEQIALMRPSKFSRNEEWYRDTETGEIYHLVPPDERGWWERVDPEELMGPEEKVD